MHSFFVGKKINKTTRLNFIENEFPITSLHLHEMSNSVIPLKTMLFETYSIDKYSFEHHIYGINGIKP
jgi:hypothetical protein